MSKKNLNSVNKLTVCPLRCECGQVQGSVHINGLKNRAICYCKSCQAFAHFLGRSHEVLNEQGGTTVVQTYPFNIKFESGEDQLCCMNLTTGAPLRWYTKCCNTPIGNTLPNYKISFVGLIEQCLVPTPEVTIERLFGPVRTHAYTEDAVGNTKPKPTGRIYAMAKLSISPLYARISGRYKTNPLFTESGEPVVQPVILSQTEHENLMSAR